MEEGIKVQLVDAIASKVEAAIEQTPEITEDEKLELNERVVAELQARLS